MSKTVIKSVRISTIAVWLAIFQAALALVTSIVYSLILFNFSSLSDAVLTSGSGASFGAADGGFIRLVIIFMVANGLVGLLGGAACAFLYNTLAGRSVAAIEIDTERELP